MGEPRFHIDMARRISTVAEAIDFLLLLEKQNRDSVKHVVLDCSAQLAKDILVQHVRSVHLGRRNYHYLMSGLVLGELPMAVNVSKGGLTYTDNLSLKLIHPKRQQEKITCCCQTMFPNVRFLCH